MLPTKLRALNDCSTDESSNNEDVPVKITKEALETKAELQYSQALQCLARDQLDEAEEQLSNLLEKEIISSLNTTLNQKDKSQSLLAHLKYCCLTNLGNLLSKKSNYCEALIHYQEALKMDNTDLNLWYRIGLTHSKLYQTDQAISAFLEGIKCNPNHWPTLDKLISLLYASNEYVCCLYHISISLNLDSGYLKGHFIKEMIFKKFPSLISYFKSYCSDGGLDIICSEIIDTNIQQKVLDEIEDIKKNDPTLSLGKSSKNTEFKPKLYAKPLAFKSWDQLGKWLLTIYDHMFENYEHSLLYEPIQFNHDSSTLNTTKNHIMVDEKCIENDFEKPSFKLDVPASKRRKSSPSLADQLKLSRRSARNKANSKVNESTLVKSIWNIMPQHLLLSKDGGDKLSINSIKWTDDSMDTMDLYRLFEFSDILSQNILKNNISEEERLKQISDDSYFGSDHEAKDLNNFMELNNKKSISDLLEIFLVIIAKKWKNVWPTNMVQVYINVFKRVWIHTDKQHITYISDSTFDSLDDEQIIQVKDEIISILTYGELLCDLYFQLKISHKPLEGSIIGGDFCSLWIGSINDALSVLDSKDNHIMMINVRFLWLRALFNLQDKDIGLTCDVLDMLLNFIGSLDEYEIVLPNLEYFYRINKKIAEQLIITLKRNNLLSTVKNLYESKEYLSVVEILKETLKPQSHTFMEIPSYKTMTRLNQYIFMLNSFLELKNYYELFKWCEPFLYEAILQHRKSLIEDWDLNQKTNQAEVINNIFYAMLESIKIEGLVVFDNLSQGYKSRLIQSVINLLSYLIETPDGNPEIDAVSPWLLIYNMLKYEETKTDDSFSSQTNNIPQSLSLLFLGHEYLGKRSWCCFEDGVLLFLTLSEIEPFINLDLYNNSLVQQVDQIFYCLYTHLIKRNRPRHVQDHHSMGLALTWPRARQLVHFYQPLELPSYDGISKSFTVNTDIEAMLKKVIALIPEEIKPNRLIDNLMVYIKGETDKLPVNDNPLPNDVKDIFYLMADFNFKNKTWSKAIRYYLLDLCNNLDRFDSWAAMALARGSQIETKLNSCQSIKNEGDIIRRAHMTGRCYKHSLKISPENTTLLIEYGTFTYSIHSFCSRLLKQETSNMSLQMFGELEEEKEKMIKIARKCFETANNVWNYTDCDSQDERWMHHYVLGKITEKNDDNSSVFMDHYLKAAQYLDSYGAEFPEHIIYTAPQYYSIEVLEIYYRIHAGALKLLEKHDNQSANEELFTKINIALDQISDMSPIADKNKKSSKIPSLDMINCKDTIKKDINLTVKQTLNNIINHVMTSETECDNSKVSLQSEFITQMSTDNSNMPVKKMKLDSSVQDTINFRWTLIQRCLAALENCIKRFPQHYKSYYRLAHFYFRSPFHKDFKKFKDLMFGERGLFVGQRPNNFFHGIWRIPVSEIDRPGSFAYHMSRCIHLLLDFLKETGDHKMLLDLATQLKYIPHLDKKYLRDNEREGISKEALFLSVQILKSEYAKTNNRCKYELLLIQVYKSYKRVIKCWQQKDNTLTALSKLLLNVYQNIVGTKDDVSIDIIIKYCQKLQTKEKEIEYKSNIENNENDLTPPVPQSEPASILNSPQALSTQMSIENQKRPYSPQVSHPLPLNTQLSNQIMSMFAPYTQSPLMFPMAQDTSYNYTLQQKLQATKQKLKRNNNKPKVESKRLTTSKTDKSEANQLINGKQKKIASIKIGIESKTMQSLKLSINKPAKLPITDSLELDKSLNISNNKLNELKSSYNLDSTVEISKLPTSMCNKLNETISQFQKQKPSNKPNKRPKTESLELDKSINISHNKFNKLKLSQKLDSTKEISKLPNSICNKFNETVSPQLQKQKPNKRLKTESLELDKSLNISNNKLNELKSSHNLDSTVEISKLPNSSCNKFNETISSQLQKQKPNKRPKTESLELEKSLNTSHDKFKELKSSHNLDSTVEISKLPNSLCNKLNDAVSSQLHVQEPSNISLEKQKSVKHTMTTTLATMAKSKTTMITKTTNSRNPKSVYIDLDSAAEQARLKSSIFQNKGPEIKNTATISLSPAMLLSSCPGLSITPVVNANDNRKTNEMLVPRQVQNIPTITTNFNFDQLQHFGNGLTITKSEKNVNKKCKPELILID